MGLTFSLPLTSTQILDGYTDVRPNDHVVELKILAIVVLHFQLFYQMTNTDEIYKIIEYTKYFQQNWNFRRINPKDNKLKSAHVIEFLRWKLGEINERPSIDVLETVKEIRIFYESQIGICEVMSSISRTFENYHLTLLKVLDLNDRKIEIKINYKEVKHLTCEIADLSNITNVVDFSIVAYVLENNKVKCMNTAVRFMNLFNGDWNKVLISKEEGEIKRRLTDELISWHKSTFTSWTYYAGPSTDVLDMQNKMIEIYTTNRSELTNSISWNLKYLEKDLYSFLVKKSFVLNFMY